MRLRLLVAGVALLPGCHSSSRAAGEPGAVRPETTVVASRTMSSAEVEREQRAGTTVDTIEVATTAIELRVGEEYNLLHLAPRGRDGAGNNVASFQPTFVVPRTEVFAVSFITLRALQPGVDTLYVEALPREPLKDPTPRRPSTRILVAVRP